MQISKRLSHHPGKSTRHRPCIRQYKTEFYISQFYIFCMTDKHSVSRDSDPNIWAQDNFFHFPQLYLCPSISFPTTFKIHFDIANILMPYQYIMAGNSANSACIVLVKIINNNIADDNSSTFHQQLCLVNPRMRALA